MPHRRRAFLALLAALALPFAPARAETACPDILLGDSLAVGMAPHARALGFTVIAQSGAGIAWLRQQTPRCARRLILVFGTNDLRGMTPAEAEAYPLRIAAVMEGGGSHADEARTIARRLVDSNLVGHDSHGVIRISYYIDWVRAGKVLAAGGRGVKKAAGWGVYAATYAAFVGAGGYGERIVAGLALLSLFFILDGNARYWGLIGIVPILTGLIGLATCSSGSGLRTMAGRQFFEGVHPCVASLASFPTARSTS